MRIERAIITGASGFIGQALTKKLLSDGAEVWAIVRNATSIEELTGYKNIHIVTAAFEDYENLPMLIEEKGFDAFFHLAWAGYGSATNNPSVQIGNVLQSCLAAASAVQLKVKRFLLADSLQERLESRNSTGDKELCSIYGAAKYCAQQMCRTVTHNGGVDYVGLMLANVYGEGDRSSRTINTFIRKMLGGEDLSLVDGSRLNGWIYIDDCVTAIIAAASAGKANQVYYIGENPRKFGDFMTVMRDTVNPTSRLNFGEYYDSTFIDFDNVDINALCRDTGFRCQTDLRESFEKTVKWIKKLDQGSGSINAH